MALITEDTLSKPYAANDYLVYEAVLFAIPPDVMLALENRLVNLQVQIPKVLFPGQGPFKSADYFASIAVALKSAIGFEGNHPRLNTSQSQENADVTNKKYLANSQRLASRLNDISRKPLVDISLAVVLVRELFELVDAFSNYPANASGIGAQSPIIQDPPEIIASKQLPMFGLLHSYRQHFFYTKIKAGPIEIVQALAPNEKMEVVIEESRSRSIERQREDEIEFNSSTSEETLDSTELSETVANSFVKNTTSRVAAEANYGASIGWGGGVSASSTVSETSSNSATQTSRTLAEVTKRQSESIKKRTKISTRSFEQTTNRSSTRHVIENTSNSAINYGLRRLYYDVNCKVEDLGPKLVIQTSVEAPGRQLATSDLVDKRETEDPAVITQTINRTGQIPEIASIQNDSTKVWEIDLEAEFFSDMSVDEKKGAMQTLVCIKNDLWMKTIGGESREFDGPWRSEFIFPNPVTRPYIVQYLFVHGTGRGRSQVTYGNFSFSFSYNTSTALPKAVIDALSRNRVGAAERILAIQSLGGQKRSRTPDGLQAEEIAILTSNALVKLFPIMFATLGMEMITVLSRVIDLKSVFFQLPEICWGELEKKNPDRSALTYQIHSESRTAKGLGASLEWKHQIDGDTQRDLFLNAVSATVCIPIRPGMESDLVDLVNYYDPTKPIAMDAGITSMIKQMDLINRAQLEVKRTSLKDGSAEVTIESSVDGLPRQWLTDLIASGEIDLPKNLSWRLVYPLISEQNVSVPMQGYVHEKIDFEVGDGSSNWRDSGESLSATKAKQYEKKRPWYCRLF